MFIILIRTVDTIFRVMILALFARAVMSWVTRDYTHPVANFIYRFTEPILIPMRSLFDKLGINQGMIDFSFIATFFALEFLNKIVVRILVRILLY